MKRRWLLLVILLTAGVWLFNVSRPGRQVMGCFDGCAVPLETPGGDLRVVSLNMLHGFPKFEFLPDRLELIASEINRLNADIVLLQEVPWTLKTGSAAQFLAEKTGMNHAYLRANGNRWAIFFEEGEAILSRYPLKNLEIKVLQPRARFYENRVVLHAIAVTPFGDMNLFVTHLTHTSSEVNFEQVQALMEFVETYPGAHTLIAGDFNALPDSTQMQIFSRAWSDSFEVQDSLYSSFTCCVEVYSPVSLPGYDKRIDYIYTGNRLIPQQLNRVFDQPVHYENGWLWPSDHAGWVANFTWLP